MTVRWYSIWRCLPVPVVSLRRLPGRIVGLCLGPLVLVRADHVDDWPTIAHELEHCRQFWRGGTVVHMLRYLADTEYRLQAELAAYQAELDACSPEERIRRLHDSARALAHGYGLGVDPHSCRELLLSAGARRLPPPDASER